MKATLYIQLISLVACLGCRTGQRPNVATDNPVKVTIRMNGVTPNTISQYKLVAQLKLCADTSGTLSTGTSFEFASFGLKKDVVCQIRLVGPKASESGVVFFNSSEDGLYFTGASVTIQEDQNGALTADAYLQKLYTGSITPQTTTWKIEAPIQASFPLSPSCTCRIECSPSIINDASLVKLATVNEGKCTFDNISGVDLTSTSCQEMVVQCGEKIYAGRWTPPLQIDASSGKINSVPAIKIQPATPTPEGDVVINTEIIKK